MLIVHYMPGNSLCTSRTSAVICRTVIICNSLYQVDMQILQEGGANHICCCSRHKRRAAASNCRLLASARFEFHSNAAAQWPVTGLVMNYSDMTSTLPCIGYSLNLPSLAKNTALLAIFEPRTAKLPKEKLNIDINDLNNEVHVHYRQFCKYSTYPICNPQIISMINPIHPIGNSLKKQKPCTKYSAQY